MNKKGQITAKKAGKVKITIKAKSTDIYASAEKTVNVTIRPKASKVTSAKGIGKTKIKVKVAKTSGVSKYQIRYSLNADMSGAKYTTTKNLTKTITGLKAGKKYYVQVRTYKNKVYSAWSKTKSARTR